eukprot:scaffold45991_cov18-Tisochrysis_lutea.AAC.6
MHMMVCLDVDVGNQGAHRCSSYPDHVLGRIICPPEFRLASLSVRSCLHESMRMRGAGGAMHSHECKDGITKNEHMMNAAIDGLNMPSVVAESAHTGLRATAYRILLPFSPTAFNVAFQTHPYRGSRSGVSHTDMGQPPLPEIACPGKRKRCVKMTFML